MHILVELRKHNHYARTQTRAKVGWTRAQEAVVGVLHQLPACLLRRLLDRIGQLAETGENSLDVAAILHCNDAALILLIAPT